jgi:hypothetical protein
VGNKSAGPGGGGTVGVAVGITGVGVAVTGIKTWVGTVVAASPEVQATKTITINPTEMGAMMAFIIRIEAFLKSGLSNVQFSPICPPLIR